MSQIQFYIRSSNDLSALATELVKVMRQNKPGIFQPMYVVTQTEGMNNWLREKIATLDGIAANIEFLRPNDIINKIFLAAGGKYNQSLSTLELAWLLFDALHQHEFINQFPEVADYYLSNPFTSGTKRMELARKVADLFDQYQVYRQDMLKGWEQDILSTNAEEERWQKDLWNVVRQKAGNRFPSKATTSEFIFQKSNDDVAASSIREQLPAIFIFGTVLLTAYHRDLLLSISQIIPVFLFLPNPAPDIYWYEDKSKREIFYLQRKGKEIESDIHANSLLSDWGKLLQNTFQLLFNNDEVINLYETTTHSLFKRDTLLHSIQYYLSTNELPQEQDFFTDKLLSDQSVVIQSCHSPAREVQTLYNYLVRLMDGNPGVYASRDIVVHVTDINLYASYIRSVFDNAPYKFRYTIADEAYTSSDSLSGALYAILAMDEKDLTAESVMQLLDFSCIRNHFGISDLDAVRDVVNAANIRHGINGSIDNDSIYVSWKYGLQRIMYGICIGGAEQYGDGPESFFPLDIIEGSGTADIIHFCYFADKLIHFIEKKKEEHSLPEWSGFVSDILHHFVFDDERNDSEEYRLLVKQVKNISNIAEQFSQKVSYAVFAKQFLPQLNNAIHEYRYAAGGITFCSLIPMRSIPFKIVAMLGLDFDKFPRKENKTGFDLMTLHPRAGDRSIKMNDKHLFLETILSAGDFLYLSYKGQSILDNSTRPPSILLDQLIAFIESHSVNSDNVLKWLLTKQPLHNFSNLYGNENGYYNYLLTKKESAHIRIENPSETVVNKTIRWNDFISFFKDPVKFYYNRVLHIYYEDQAYTLPESEMFALDHLSKWNLKRSWLYEKDESLEDFTLTQIQQGNLPLKNSGRLEMQLLAEEMEDIKAAFLNLAGESPESVMNISLEIDGFKIEGVVENIFENKVLYPCLSKTEDKYLFLTYLTTLAIAATGSGKEVCFVGKNIQKAKEIKPKTAVQYLSELLAAYQDGLRRITFFMPEWGTDLEKIRQLNSDKFKLDVKCKYNRYLTKETENREAENILDEYKRISEVILKGFKEVF